jgi:hypothetical protein
VALTAMASARLLLRAVGVLGSSRGRRRVVFGGWEMWTGRRAASLPCAVLSPIPSPPRAAARPWRPLEAPTPVQVAEPFPAPEVSGCQELGLDLGLGLAHEGLFLSSGGPCPMDTMWASDSAKAPGQDLAESPNRLEGGLLVPSHIWL